MEENKTVEDTQVEQQQSPEISNADKFWEIHYKMYEEKKKNLQKIPVEIKWKDQLKQIWK